MARTRLEPFFAALLIFTVSYAGLRPSVAAAQDAYGCIGRLSDEEVTYRLRYLIGRFDAGKRRARMFWYGWGAFGVGAAAATWTLFALTKNDGRNERDPALISAIGSTLLLVQTGALPLGAAYAPNRLARMADSTPEERVEKLRRATRLLERSARRADSLRGIGGHVGAVAFGLAGGTYMTVRHDEVLATIQAYLAPPAIGELKIYSLPMQAYYDWERYRGFACQVPDMRPIEVEPLVEARDGERALAWSIVPAPFGLGVRLGF